MVRKRKNPVAFSLSVTLQYYIRQLFPLQTEKKKRSSKVEDSTTDMKEVISNIVQQPVKQIEKPHMKA